MKKRFFRTVLAITLSLTYLLYSGVVFADALGQYFDTGGDDYNALFSDDRYGQSFTVGVSPFEVTSVDLYLWRIGTTGSIALDIYDTTAGLPVGGSLASSIINATTDVTLDEDAGFQEGEYWTTFDFENYILSANTTYALVASTWGWTGDVNTNVVRWGDDENGAYSGGTKLTDSPVEWSGLDGDFYFRTYGLSSPSITTMPADNITYNYMFQDYDVNFNAYIDSDGGENVTIGWIVRQLPGGEFAYRAGASGEYQTGDNVTTTITGSGYQSGESFEYYSRATNSQGYTDGNTENFTIVSPEQKPTILTWASPISTNATALTATLYGEVDYDGTDNVTAYIYWRELGAGEWSVSDNTTDLQTGDTFNATIAGLSLETTYQFQAGGVNTFGEGLGTVAQFTIITVSQPNVETLPATFISNNSAYVTGNVTNLGNDTQLTSWFQYRDVGNHIWYESSIAILSEIGTYTKQITGLEPETNYEFRAIVRASVLGGSETFTDYGDSLTFATFTLSSIPIMVTGNATFLAEGFIGLRSVVYYDGGSDVTVWVEYRGEGSANWTETVKSYGLTSNQEITLMASGLENDVIYEYKSMGLNNIGPGEGSIRKFYLTVDDITTGDVDTPPITGNILTDWINDFRASTGLTGTFGTWAFMGLLVLLTSLLFGMAMIVVDTAIARSAIAVAWIIVSIAIVGGFMFTGQLGIWPIVVMAGGTVALIIIVVSVKIGGSSNG